MCRGAMTMVGASCARNVWMTERSAGSSCSRTEASRTVCRAWSSGGRSLSKGSDTAGMAVAVARSNLMFGTASTLSPPKIRAKRPASAFEMAQTYLGAMDSQKPGMTASSLR